MVASLGVFLKVFLAVVLQVRASVWMMRTCRQTLSLGEGGVEGDWSHMQVLRGRN